MGTVKIVRETEYSSVPNRNVRVKEFRVERLLIAVRNVNCMTKHSSQNMTLQLRCIWLFNKKTNGLLPLKFIYQTHPEIRPTCRLVNPLPFI